MKLTLSQNAWPIRGSFTISRGSKTHADTIVVNLEKDGVVGRGECVPYARYGESLDSVRAEIEAIRPSLKAKYHDKLFNNCFLLPQQETPLTVHCGTLNVN
ncbi:muconate cycloisomerase [Vibrio astriarenae]|nr:muconate cycloisomerase [Vibrio sp. C7]